MFRKRNRIAMFFLMEILRVIYLFYWQCSVQNEVRRATQHGVGGGVTVFLSIITLGIYAIVWQWKTCKSLHKLGCTDRSVICLIFSLLIIGIIVNPLIIQGQINLLSGRGLNVNLLHN